MSSELVRVDTTALPLAEIASALYNIDDHIFENMYLNFSELSLPAQKLLTEAGLYPINPAVGDDDAALYQQPLLVLRKARQERLGRTLEGVNRALIYGLITNNPTLHAQFTSAFNVKSNIANVAQFLPSLQGVLVPELQGHLDCYMEEIDALLWFEVALRKNGKNPMTKA
ncbi:hypothetical protein D9619_011502 [Psilocybe cf. subviscida]|uniref:Uncharacterized protein n=1 Tax=Psilocybe cf. subviscida TaxID=2480587 RepID=A0A8H5BSM6_9AGAR|nr:hypothetical protein D9619_011502 [Psilocybe cf. subviscida]